MDIPLIEGVQLAPIKEIHTDGGPVLHMVRKGSDLFTQFGEVYFSMVNPGAVKAWKRHRKMTQLLAVPVGLVEFVIYDPRPTSASQGRICKIVLGRPIHYNLLKVPPEVWYGFRSLSKDTSLIANCTDLPHEAEEVERLPADSASIPFSFSSRA